MTFTPDTYIVRTRYATYNNPPDDLWEIAMRTHGPEFDRWLARVKYETLRGAALSGNFGTTAQSTLLRMSEEYLEGQGR